MKKSKSGIKKIGDANRGEKIIGMEKKDQN